MRFDLGLFPAILWTKVDQFPKVHLWSQITAIDRIHVVTIVHGVKYRSHRLATCTTVRASELRVGNLIMNVVQEAILRYRVASLRAFKVFVIGEIDLHIFYRLVSLMALPEPAVILGIVVG